MGRAALRRLLGQRLAVAPAELRFDYGERGKPDLEGGGVSFNLSHSGDLALVAISDCGPIGVDLERLRLRFQLHRLSRRVLTEDEQVLLDQANLAGGGAEWFLRCWTAKEAVAKAFGFGLALAPGRINVVPDGADQAFAEVFPSEAGPLPEGARALRVRWLPGLVHAIAAVVATDAHLEECGWRQFSLG